MKAVVFHGVGDIRLDDVSEPPLRDDTDAIVRLTASAICGTDLHMVRGTMSECGSAPFSVMRVSGSSSSSGRWCAISRSATASLSARRLPAAPAPIAAPAISPSAIRPIRTAAGPARRSSAAQVRPVHGLQAEKRAFPTPMSAWSPRLIRAIIDGSAPASITVTGLAKVLCQSASILPPYQSQF